MNALLQPENTDRPNAQDDLVYVPIQSIRVLPEFNPRKRFSDQETAEFAERIKASGWLSPLLVRPDPASEGDHYLLVAGERRFRAVSYLGWAEVPVTIKNLDDVEHRRLALAENVDRRDLTIAEEAMAARDHVDAYEGDHDAAAAALGWPVKRLKHRLRLLHATSEVMDALLQDKIQLGHAELLAAIPAETQAKALPRILEAGLSVVQVREMLNGFATPLEKALFDLAGCANCPFNSECQSSLFATHINAGLCTNKQCFNDKTAEAVAAKRESLKEEFGTVALLSEKTPGTTTPLLKFGEMGVGEAQFDACRSCAFRGAILNDTPGNQCGTVESPVCFNLTCHREKREDYQASLQQAAPAEDEDAPTPAPAQRGKPTAKSKATTGKKGKAAPKPKATQTSVVNQLAGIPRRAALAAVQTDPKWPQAFATFALMQLAVTDTPKLGLSGICKHISLPFSIAATTGSNNKLNNELLLGLQELSEEVLMKIQLDLTLLILGHSPDDTVFHNKLSRRNLNAAIASRTCTDLTPFVQIDDAYLAAHTRAALEVELEDSGFKAWMEAKDDGQKSYADIKGARKDDGIRKVLGAGYDFSGYIPESLKSEMKAWLSYTKN